MNTSEYVGYWVGSFEGTNQGGLTADIREENGKLVGTAKFSEPAHGRYEYNIKSVSVEPLVAACAGSCVRSNPIGPIADSGRLAT